MITSEEIECAPETIFECICDIRDLIRSYEADGIMTFEGDAMSIGLRKLVFKWYRIGLEHGWATEKFRRVSIKSE